MVCGVRAEILLASDVPHLKISRADGSASTGGDKGNVSADDGATQEGREIDMKGLDLLVPNIELATGCSPQYLPGQPPSVLAQSLSTRIREGLFSTGVVGEEGMGIWYQHPNLPNESEMDEMMEEDGETTTDPASEQWEIKGFWTLYIDILFISLDGNPFDAAWAAVMAALHDVRLPRAYWDADREMILCSDAVAESRKLQLRGLPMAVTAVVFKTKERGGSAQGTSKWILVDPDMFEEGLCDESVTLIVDRGEEGAKTRILGMSKVGGGVVGKKEMREVLELAEKRWMEFAKVIKG